MLGMSMRHAQTTSMVRFTVLAFTDVLACLERSCSTISERLSTYTVEVILLLVEKLNYTTALTLP